LKISMQPCLRSPKVCLTRKVLRLERSSMISRKSPFSVANMVLPSPSLSSRHSITQCRKWVVGPCKGFSPLVEEFLNWKVFSVEGPSSLRRTTWALVLRVVFLGASAV
jgi:hypothetical protein